MQAWCLAFALRVAQRQRARLEIRVGNGCAQQLRGPLPAQEHAEPDGVVRWRVVELAEQRPELGCSKHPIAGARSADGRGCCYWVCVKLEFLERQRITSDRRLIRSA